MTLSTKGEKSRRELFPAICRLAAVLLFAFGNWFCWYSLFIHDEHAARNWDAGNYLHFLVPLIVGVVVGILLAGGVWFAPSALTPFTRLGNRVVVLLGLLLSFVVMFYLGQSEVLAGLGITQWYGIRPHRLIDGMGSLIVAAANGYAVYRVLRQK